MKKFLVKSSVAPASDHSLECPVCRKTGFSMGSLQKHVNQCLEYASIAQTPIASSSIDSKNVPAEFNQSRIPLAQRNAHPNKSIEKKAPNHVNSKPNHQSDTLHYLSDHGIYDNSNIRSRDSVNCPTGSLLAESTSLTSRSPKGFEMHSEEKNPISSEKHRLPAHILHKSYVSLLNDVCYSTDSLLNRSNQQANETSSLCLNQEDIKDIKDMSESMNIESFSKHYPQKKIFHNQNTVEKLSNQMSFDLLHQILDTSHFNKPLASPTNNLSTQEFKDSREIINVLPKNIHLLISQRPIPLDITNSDLDWVKPEYHPDCISKTEFEEVGLLNRVPWQHVFNQFWTAAPLVVLAVYQSRIQACYSMAKILRPQALVETNNVSIVECVEWTPSIDRQAINKEAVDLFWDFLGDIASPEISATDDINKVESRKRALENGDSVNNSSTSGLEFNNQNRNVGSEKAISSISPVKVIRVNNLIPESLQPQPKRPNLHQNMSKKSNSAQNHSASNSLVYAPSTGSNVSEPQVNHADADYEIPISTSQPVSLKTVNSQPTIDLSPYLVSVIPEGVGCATVVRVDGCTIRDGVDIDNSNVITKCAFDEILFFDEVVNFPASYDDDVDVKRLHVYYTCPGGKTIHGWTSERGRLKEDNGSILEILYDSKIPSSNCSAVLSLSVSNDKQVIPAISNQTVETSGVRYQDSSRTVTGEANDTCPVCEEPYASIIERMRGDAMYRNVKDLRKIHFEECFKSFAS